MDIKVRFYDYNTGRTAKVDLKGAEIRPEDILRNAYNFVTGLDLKSIERQPGPHVEFKVHPLSNVPTYSGPVHHAINTPQPFQFDLEAEIIKRYGSLKNWSIEMERRAEGERPFSWTPTQQPEKWPPYVDDVKHVQEPEGWEKDAEQYEIIDSPPPADEPGEAAQEIPRHMSYDELREKGVLNGPSLASRFPMDYEPAIVEARNLDGGGAPTGIKFDEDGHPMFQTRYICTCGKRSKRFVYNRSAYCKSHCCNTRLKIEFASNKNLRDVYGNFYKAVKVYEG